MILGLGSMRRRIIALSLVLSSVLVGSALYTRLEVGEAAQRYQQQLTLQQQFSSGISDYKNTFFNMESGLYRYAVLQDEGARDSVEVLLNELGERGRVLERTPFLLAKADLQPDFVELKTVLEQARQETRHLLQIISTLGLRFPASTLITDNLYPLNMAFNAALEEALLEAELDSGRGHSDLLRVLHEIRYLWSQQISVVRVYIANRSGVFGVAEAGMRQQLMDRQNYIDEIRRHLASLQRQYAKGRKSLVLGDAVARMSITVNTYEDDFARVVDIYQSEQWRGDIAELRTTIQPLFMQVRQGFSTVEEHMAALSSEGMRDTLSLASRLNGFLWQITAFTVGLLALGYFAYELTIRRPIQQVIDALQALGKGEAYTPLLKTRVQEMETLVSAFREMQHQVNSRETRLASILDNASDGIITINEQGIIETFNNAAESLFGYQSDEVIGRNVRLLMPSPMREEHDGYLQHYLDTGEQRLIGNEVNVSAMRKDGTLFPMSIKVGEVILDGGHYFTAIVSDISERKAMLDNLRQMAERDSLTGLYNRQYFIEELERLTQRAVRQGGLDSALLYIDLDNFKYVNDTLGHLAGDRVLVEVSSMLLRRGRKSDLIARLGGDEFAVLLYDLDETSAVATAEGFRQMLADYHFRHEGRVVDVGCSIGVAMFEDGVQTREEIMARADIACHMAKRSGRNAVHRYQDSDRASVDSMFADMGWARTIKQAIEEDRFAFALQPIVRTAGRAVAGYEVLLRLRGEGDELIMPAGFLPSAERFGLMLEVDRWVVRNAIALLGGSEIEHTARVSINLSAKAVGDAEVLRLIHDGLQQFSHAVGRLNFEITETIAMADLTAAAEFMHQLRDLGCTTALDDFGVGYSSFAYLKDLPVDFVKIDGSFVRNIGSDPVHLALVKSMHDIAHAMGKQTVAEYVENEQILAALQTIGVDYVQGYLLGKPRLVACPNN